MHGYTSIFDPLSLIILFVINMKELYQDASKQKFKWDKIKNFKNDGNIFYHYLLKLKKSKFVISIR